MYGIGLGKLTKLQLFESDSSRAIVSFGEYLLNSQYITKKRYYYVATLSKYKTT